MRMGETMRVMSPLIKRIELDLKYLTFFDSLEAVTSFEAFWFAITKKKKRGFCRPHFIDFLPLCLKC